VSAEVIIITSRSFGSGQEDTATPLVEAGYEVVRADPRHQLAELREPLRRAVGWIAGAAPVGREHLELAPRLRVLARYGVGTDAVDRHELARRHVTLTNTPETNTGSVADHAVGLMLAVLRGTVTADRAMRDGRPHTAVGRELAGCTVGLVGFGAVGRAVQRRLIAFGTTVVANDPFVDRPAVGDVDLLSLHELASRSDLVSLHCPPTDTPIVDATFLELVPRGGFLVNTARAGLVDEEAVAEALRDGRLGGAALDVSTAERGGVSPLLTAPNVVLTPHISGHTSEAIDRMGALAVAEVLRVLRDEPPRHPVEPPDGALPTGRR
jgi:D-3-phosphoglycerate dehydrogenase / 2-oxoglutarate reductase